MTDPPTNENRTPPRLDNAMWGAVLGFVVSLIFVPVTLMAQTKAVVTRPNPTPGYYSTHPIELPTSYWVSWLVAIGLVLLPGLASLVFPKDLFPRARWIAIGYIVVAGTLVTLETLAVIGFEFSGFGPT